MLAAFLSTRHRRRITFNISSALGLTTTLSHFVFCFCFVFSPSRARRYQRTRVKQQGNQISFLAPNPRGPPTAAPLDRVKTISVTPEPGIGFSFDWSIQMTKKKKHTYDINDQKTPGLPPQLPSQLIHSSALIVSEQQREECRNAKVKQKKIIVEIQKEET